MLLEIVKDLPYISPSSFMAWKNCQYYTYLTKCAGHKIPKQPDSKNAAFGTIVDIVLKTHINAKHGWSYDSKKAWDNVNLTVENKDVIRDAIELAKLLIDCIKRYRLMEDVEETTDGMHGEFRSIPIFGYPDFQCKGQRPLDLKTTGYGVSYTVSPKKGYKICYNLDSGGIYKDHHKNEGDPLNLIDEAWATQLLFYNWMMAGGEPRDLLSGKIFQVIVDRRLLAVYDAWIEDEFAEQVGQDLLAMWEMYKQGSDIPEPQPGEVNCKRYNTICNAAEFCGFYKEWSKLC